VRAERQVDVQMADGAHDGPASARFGRATSSPPQFGQTCAISSVHQRQNVHLYEQM